MQVIRVRGAAAPRVFELELLVYIISLSNFNTIIVQGHRQQMKRCNSSIHIKEVELYQRHKEEGYDIPDPRYLFWSQIESRNLQSPLQLSDQQSSCQDGSCGHPKARQWIKCDYCQRWYHCLFAKVAHRKAYDTVYACPLCKA